MLSEVIHKKNSCNVTYMLKFNLILFMIGTTNYTFNLNPSTERSVFECVLDRGNKTFISVDAGRLKLGPTKKAL